MQIDWIRTVLVAVVGIGGGFVFGRLDGKKLKQIIYIAMIISGILMIF